MDASAEPQPSLSRGWVPPPWLVLFAPLTICGFGVKLEASKPVTPAAPEPSPSLPPGD
jgi:hypothetical protein